MTTLTEVAKLAGVTAATVSNVLRNRGKVGVATRQRVLEAVDALGYRPHLTARALAEGSAPTLALMVSSIANPFYPEFALAAERAARKAVAFSSSATPTKIRRSAGRTSNRSRVRCPKACS